MQKLYLYENAHFIAGSEGSAFHLLMGIRNPILKVILLTKKIPSPGEDTQINLNMQFSSLNTQVAIINCLKGIGNKKGSGQDVTLFENYSSKSIPRIINALTL